jgi:acetyl esterase
MPKAQILIYPATDLTMSLPSHERYGQGFFLDRAMIEWFRKRYFTDLERAAEVGASPLFAEDMRGLPPAVVVTAGFDPLRDEGEAYAAALESAGIAVRFRCESALIHGFINMGGICAEARAATDRIADDLAELL